MGRKQGRETIDYNSRIAKFILGIIFLGFIAGVIAAIVKTFIDAL